MLSKYEVKLIFNPQIFEISCDGENRIKIDCELRLGKI